MAMKQVYLKFPHNEWGVVVCFDFDVNGEYDVMYEQLRSFGMKPKNIEKALSILSYYNTGMCVSNETLKMSAIVLPSPITVQPVRLANRVFRRFKRVFI